MHEDARAGMVALRFDSLPADQIDVLVSTRVGGESIGPFASLNLGLRVPDKDATVVKNRERFFAAYELPLDRSVWCEQVHRDDVTVVTEADVPVRTDVLENGSRVDRRDRGAFTEATIIGATDALVTDLIGVPLCVTLADCVPVVLYDAVHHAVGLAHAGWGGTVSRIASRTVSVMTERYGTDPAQLVAGIGPSISPDRYEVGRDVIEQAVAAYGDGSVLRDLGDGKALLDLWEANAVDLESAGVSRERIEISAISTIDALDTFYSHRAEQVTGRLVAAVTLR